MTFHQFHFGQTVYVRSSAFAGEAAEGLYEISRLLKKFVGELIFAMFPSQAEASRRDDLRYRLRIRYLFASSWLLQTDSSRCGQYLWDANEIVGGRGEDEEPFDQRPSAVPGFAQAADS